MNLKDKLQINTETLDPIVQKVLKDGPVQITEWWAEEVSGGTIGKVYLINGKARNYKKGMELPWAVVLKIQSQYIRFGDPESWKREKLLYQSNFFTTLPKTLKVPQCLHITENDEGEIWLWLERVVGKHGKQMELNDYALAARHLAHFQCQYLIGKSLPQHHWLSTGYWVVKNVIDWGTGAIPWLFKNEANSDKFFPDELNKKILLLWEERDRFLDILHTLPRTFCHRDFFSGNIFVQDKFTTLIDWDCAGIGMIGEDIADMVGEALVFDGFDITKAIELKEAVYRSYLSGLRDGDWHGDEKNLRLGFLIGLILNWTFRIVCRFKDTDDEEIQNKYIHICRFILAQADEVRRIVG